MVELLRNADPETVRKEQYWEMDLDRDRNGVISNTFHNLAVILECDELLRGVRFNRLSGSIEVTAKLPWREVRQGGKGWREADDAHLMNYIETWFGTFSQSFYPAALLRAADNRAFHPVVDYVKDLPPWDGVPRVETLLVDYLGAEDTPYVRAVTLRMLVAALWRVFTPGIKFDNLLVLAGPQGIGKSTLLSRLGGEWYSDVLTLSDMNDKSAAEKLHGAWLMEIGEMAGMKKAEVEKVKAFFSRQDDRYRPAYARRVESHPRQCVFFGTTNSVGGYLRDVTGNRRFWTVEVTGNSPQKPWDLDPATVAQIWSEAVTRVEDTPLTLPPELERNAEEHQREALEEDELFGLVQGYLNIPLPKNWLEASEAERIMYYQHPSCSKLGYGLTNRETVCGLEIWCECFGKRKEDLTKKDSGRIAMIMAKMPGWERTGEFQYHPIYGKQRFYVRKKQDGKTGRDADPA